MVITEPVVLYVQPTRFGFEVEINNSTVDQDAADAVFEAANQALADLYQRK